MLPCLDRPQAVVLFANAHSSYCLDIFISRTLLIIAITIRGGVVSHNIATISRWKSGWNELIVTIKAKGGNDIDTATYIAYLNGKKHTFHHSIAKIPIYE
jgi:hypothetical protein